MPTPENAVLRVGDGRGFVVERRFGRGTDRIIIAAAHCLPVCRHLRAPVGAATPHPARYLKEATYQDLLGPLGAKPTVWAHCLFVDPVADIAVLCQPDNQELCDEAEAYDALIESMQPLRLLARQQWASRLSLPASSRSKRQHPAGDPRACSRSMAIGSK